MTTAADDAFVIGIDVGTTSVRAGIVSARTGRLVATARHNIQTWSPRADFHQQSSNNIWSALVTSVRNCLTLSKIPANAIKGIGVDATCSLVVLGENNLPLSVDPTSDDDEQNIILWMDHRAVQQAKHINATKHPLLRYVGNAISVEMELPKLLWLKQHKATTYAAARKFLDLADFVTYTATGTDGSHQHTLTGAHEAHRTSHNDDDFDHGWSRSFFKQIGLEDHITDKFGRIGEAFCCQAIGRPIGNGLTEKAAQEMGLLPGTVVSTGIIDAHAGGIGIVGARLPTDVDSKVTLNGRLALIMGTSTCHMLTTDKPTFCKGVWGPYYSAMVPEMWLLEGGQSSAASLLDYIIDSHSLGVSLRAKAEELNVNVFDCLNDHLLDLAQRRHVVNVAYLSRDVHVLPDFHGNRSPRADASLTGVVTGLTLSRDLDSLAVVYLSAVQALAFGTKHIVETLQTTSAADTEHDSGSAIKVTEMFVCGGLSRNNLLLQCHADVCGVDVWRNASRDSDAMILGSGMMAACAAGIYDSMRSAMEAMSCQNERVAACETQSELAEYYRRKYQVFLQLHEDQMKYRQMMDTAQKAF